MIISVSHGWVVVRRVIRILRTISPFLLAAALITPVRAGQGIGFQASLWTLSEVVSPYDAPIYRFSAALYPKTHPLLSPKLGFSPELDESSFDNNAFRFILTLNQKVPLIPVSVDAKKYMGYRISRNEVLARDSLAVRGMKAGRKRAGRGGLSIGVPLPKRMERLVGEGGGNLTVSGYEQVSFSGRSQWTDRQSTDRFRQTKFPALNMDQISRFEISGTVGSKISVKVTEDNRTDIPLANRIQIRYKGDEDDILKTVEAGNTTLSLPNTRFIGYSRSIQGLFGLKAEAQVGGMRLTAIASQEKGTSEHATVSATTEQGARIIRDAQYSEGRMYDLWDANDVIPMLPRDSIITLYLYEERPIDSVRFQMAHCFPDPFQLTDSSKAERYRVAEVVRPTETSGASQQSFQWIDDPARNLHYIIFQIPHTSWALSVYFEFQRRQPDGRVDTIKVGSIAGEELILKKLRAKNFVPSDPTWYRMWRNCYDIPYNTRIEDLDIKIFKGLTGDEASGQNLSYQVAEGKQFSYLTILGLDLQNSSGSPIADNRVDNVEAILRPSLGLLIFPNRYPFQSDTTYPLGTGRTLPLADAAPDIYNFNDFRRPQGSKYYLQLATKTRSSIIRLTQSNIIPGSERLMLNGRQLQKDVDYQISYEIGQITLLKEEAVDPSAQLSVDFEFAPFLALQKKTLFGMRAEYEASRDLRIGATFLYKSDKAEERKPRVGRETARGTVAGFDFSLNLYPKFLTKVVNALPFVTTDAQSALSISGEVAQSRPNPNVTGVAYVDDFEGTVEKSTLGLDRVNWRLCSPPEQMKDPSAGGPANLMDRRARVLWYSPPPIRWEDVYKSTPKQGEGLISTFRLVYRPDTTGMWPIKATAPGAKWGGIQSPIRTLDEARLRLLEIRVKGNKGILHFDIGQISEDINNNGQDDKGENINGITNHITANEDIGLDGLADANEPGYNPDTLPDPNRDDFRSYVDASTYDANLPPVARDRLTAAFKDSVVGVHDVLRYDWINGTEGNLQDGSGDDSPDQEARISSSFQWQSNYFAYHINLDTLVSDTFLVPASTNSKGWRTYRIPVRDTAFWDGHFRSSSSPAALRWNEANYIRVWLESPDGDPDTLTVDVANWYFVSTNWRDTIRTAITSPPQTEHSGSKFYVASVSEEENTNFTPPPGVEAYYDKTSGVTETQRAMTLVYDSLYPNDTCMAVKELLSIDRYTGYRHLKMFVHGPASADSQKIRFILRIGLDAKNFYEYRTLLKPGWHGDNDVDMDFNVLTGFKDELIRRRDSSKKVLSDSLGPDYHYYIYGSPNTNQVKYLAVAVINLDTNKVAARPKQISGEVWVDELRVTDVRADVGTAARFDVSGRLADLINFGFNFESKDPYFRGLAAATRGGSDVNLGSGSSTKSLGGSFSMGLQKFLPKSWNAMLPVSFSFSQSEQLPLLATQSDIVLPAKARQLEKSTSNSKSFNISESLSKKSRNPLFSMLLNRQRSSFNYSRTFRSALALPYSLNEQYTVHGEYDMGYDRFKPLPIFFWTKRIPYLKKLQTAKLGYYPNMWRFSGNLARTLNITRDNKNDMRSSLSRTLDYNMNLEYKVFQNIALSYTMTSRRDLSDTAKLRFKLSDFRLGDELNYNQSFRTGWNPSVFSFLSSSFGYSSTYSDNYNPQSHFRNGDVSTTWSVSGQFNHQVLLGGKAVSGGASMPQPIAPKAKPKKPSGPFYEPPRKLIRSLTSWINPISYRYQSTFNSSIPGMIERPRQMYRLGISRSPDVHIANQTLSQRHSGEGQQYEFSSGFSLLGGLVLDVKLRRDISRDLILVGERMERISASWPDLNIRIQPFKKFPLIKKQLNKFIQVFTPRTSYSRQTRDEKNITKGVFTNRSSSISQSPLLAVNFRAFRALSLSGSYNLTSTEASSFAKDGSLVAITRTRNKSVGITLQYSFSAPGGIGLPLLGKVKFTSQMQISTDVRFNSSYGETEKPDGSKSKMRDATDFAVAPNIAYQFSSQIKGGLMARWQDAHDGSNVNHTRELRLWAEIRF
jgi:hypothetical protein